MSRGASSQSLLYVGASDGTVYVYTYPGRQLAGQLAVSAAWECLDSSGDVFIPSSSGTTGTVYEYAHGGTEPINVLNDPGEPFGCSFDPTTGNLAVANGYDSHNPYAIGNGSIAVYSGPEGNPKMYYPSAFGVILCGYDDQGNLYISTANGRNRQAGLARLARGGSSFESLLVNTSIYFTTAFLPAVQWDGKHITVSSNDSYGQPVDVYRLKVSKDQAKVIGTTTLHSPKDVHSGQTWISGTGIFGIYYHRGFLHVSGWPYPGGGNPDWSVRRKSDVVFDGIVLSPAPR